MLRRATSYALASAGIPPPVRPGAALRSDLLRPRPARRPPSEVGGAGCGRRRHLSGGGGGGASASSSAEAAAAAAEAERAHRSARRRAYENYRKRNTLSLFPPGVSAFFRRIRGGGGSSSSSSSGGGGGGGGGGGPTLSERNARIASYAAAAVVGALGATYASVPLYKMFCQATGFGGTTRRVTLTEWAEEDEGGEGTGRGKISRAMWDRLTSMSNVPREMLPKRGASHGRGGARTWTDEEAAERLASLKPVKGGRLITVRFDSTVGDVMPWSFVPTQLDVKVVPGETALSFFTATNNSTDRAITGVATYNVHPPRAGLYFNKIQCFCFEEQRLLPGETVDMPVFFFIDPGYAEDPQLSGCNNVTLSYTFFQTDYDEDDEEEYDDDEEDDDEEEAEEEEEGDNAVAKEGATATRGWLRGWQWWPSR